MGISARRPPILHVTKGPLVTAWTAKELGSLDRPNEIRVAGRRDDGSLHKLVIIWHIVVNGTCYAR